MLTQPITTVLMAAAVVLLLAAIPPASAFHWPWKPPYDVHILNELSGNKVLYVHCRCTDMERPESWVNPGTQYEWTFKPHILKPTRWQCYMKPDNSRNIDFIAYDKHINTYDYNVYWIVKDDGIYSRGTDGGSDALKYRWKNN
ncbi:S-protein homolog 1 [Linum grandiflorum]